MINKQELKYIIYSGLFAILYFIVFLPRVVNYGEIISPFLQFIIFNLGILIFLQLFLKSSTLNTKLKWRLSVGLIFLILAIDAWNPPLHVGIDGTLLTSNSLFYKAAIDYNLGNIAINTLGLNGLPVFIFTYIIIPILLLLICATLIPNFVRQL